MAAGDFAGKVLRMTAGIVSEIDPKNTLKLMSKESMEQLNKNSGAFRAGKKATNFLAGGIRDTISNNKNMGFKDAIKAAHSTTVKVTDAKMAKELGVEVGSNISKLSGKKIAGTAIGIGLAGRIVTGGGIYRDKNGNTNLPGVPFI